MRLLENLGKIASLIAVQGNMDNGAWAQALPEVKLVEFGNVRVYVFHDVYQLEIKPNTAGIHVIVSGHTYYPAIEKKNGVLFVNPGSASQPRFN